MKRIQHFLMAVLVALTIPAHDVRAEISTTEIMESSFNWECVDWELRGICVWLTCGWHGCSLSISLQVSHFNPDLVVSAYSMTGKNPWKEVQNFSRFSATAGGFGFIKGNSTEKQRPSDMAFKNADAIGHPGDISELLGDMLMCRSVTTPFMPYFISTLDPYWRIGLNEELYPATWIPGLREIQLGVGNVNVERWGNVYPRQAFVVQADDRKASAVAAQRAADITASSYPGLPPHIFMTSLMPNSSGQWRPRNLIESDPLNHKWQLLYPEMSSTCAVFPDPRTIPMKVAEQYEYTWALWRPYTCCQRAGKKLISYTTPKYH